MDSQGGRSAIVVPVSLPAALEAIRQDHVENARRGVPAHVTLLFPFVPAADLNASHLDGAVAVVGRTASFDVEFREVTTFDPLPSKEGVVWLAPEPPEPFIGLINALAEAFPGYLPYEGLHDTVIPHLTLASVDVDVRALLAEARPVLPFTRRVNAAALLVEDEAGSWRLARELPFG